MNIKYRMSKEGFPSILSKKIDIGIESAVRPYILKRQSEAIPPFDIRHSIFCGSFFTYPKCSSGKSLET